MHGSCPYQVPRARASGLPQGHGAARDADRTVLGAIRGAPVAGNVLPLTPTMRAELIGHLKPCMTEIYLHFLCARCEIYLPFRG